MKKWLLLFGSLVAGSVYANCQPQALTIPMQLMAQRAAMIKQVAAYKWYHAHQHHATPYRAERELVVLQNAQQIAKQQGLNPYKLMVFVQVQMDLSKLIESYWIEHWNNPNTPEQKKPNAHTIVSLNTLRMTLGKLDAKLYPAIKDALPKIQQCPLTAIQPIYQHAFAPIQGIAQHPNYGMVYLQALKDLAGS